MKKKRYPEQQWKKGLLLICMAFFTVGRVAAQQKNSFIDFINQSHPWVDSVFNKLSARERVAQLFMIRAQSDASRGEIDAIGKIIAKEQLGGIVLFQGGPVRQARLINQYQQSVKVPLLTAIDGEWGLGMRMPDSSISYPYQMTLGAIRDDGLLYRMGQEVAKDFKRMGIHVNFAPVVDINNNPRNPVINYRSFGENKENVARKGMAYMRGMMDAGLLNTLKHFPGHGDTDVDSHYDLPQLTFSRQRLDSLEMVPFRQLVNNGASGVMVAHMNIPALDKTPNLPSSLSRKVVTGLLKEQLGFKGFVITDAMDMNGVVKYFRNGEADVRALMAGNDLLELSQNSARGITMVLKAISDGRLPQKEIDLKVKKMLAIKYWLRLDQQKPIALPGLYSAINRPMAKTLNKQLANAAITLLKSDSLLHAVNYSKHTAIIAIGTEQVSEFQKTLNARFDNKLNFLLSAQATADDVARVAAELQRYEQIIVALYDNRSKPQSVLNYNATVRLFINELASKPAIFCVFANPYSLAGLPGIEAAKTILIGYQNDSNMQKAAANIILRQLLPSGKLPVTINSYFRYGDGLTMK